MGTPVEINPLEFSSSSGAGYQISRSVRLRASATAYFSRTFGTPTNNTKWTYSTWFKRGYLGVSACNIGMSNGTDNQQLYFDHSFGPETLRWLNGAAGYVFTTTQLFRDPSAWYHLVLAVDAAASGTNKVALYINGVAVTSFSADNRASFASTSINTAVVQNLFRSLNYANYFDGYVAETYFVDGQQLAASSFGYTDSNGIWQPKAYTGTYGNNGFYLKYTDNSAATAAAIGKDYSGNGNNWTPNNISVTAGTTYDSMIDSPTVGAGASNYCTWNPLSSNNFSTPNDGNLKFDIPNVRSCLGTIAMSSGKWYCEMQMSQVGAVVGVSTATNTYTAAGSNDAFSTNGWGYISTGSKRSSGGDVAYGASWTTTDIIGIAYDAGAGSLTFYKNGVSQGVAFTGITVPVVFAAYGAAGTTGGTYAYLNCGQRPFTYTPPSGFAALNTYNIFAGSITTSGTFIGNLSNDGPFVYLNGVPTAMTINGNAVTFANQVDKTANGFKVRSSSSSYNSSGLNSYIITTTGAKFKYANAQVNP